MYGFRFPVWIRVSASMKRSGLDGAEEWGNYLRSSLSTSTLMSWFRRRWIAPRIFLRKRLVRV